MLRHFDRKRLGASLCLATLGILGISSNVQAQRASAPFKHPSSALTTIQRIVNLPGLGPRLLNLRVLPASACYLDTKKEGGISLDAASDPTLYCSFYDYSGDTFIDPVWNFPTVGFAATTDPRGLFVIPTTIQTGATAPNNVAYIALGEMGLSDGGKKPQIRSINFVGGLYDVSDANFATPKKGAVIIILFDGVDQNTAPSATNIAKTLSGLMATWLPLQRAFPLETTVLMWILTQSSLTMHKGNLGFWQPKGMIRVMQILRILLALPLLNSLRLSVLLLGQTRPTS